LILRDYHRIDLLVKVCQPRYIGVSDGFRRSVKEATPILNILGDEDALRETPVR